MRRIIIGTAGHVDHGKTTLVKAITGVNTDRWAEEQKRGLTIDLGFAPFTLPSGKKAAIIDVPGHERFIKNMLAGVSGIDVVILVVAADEGVMPQTQEHLDILNLLQVNYGVVALTKKDLVDEELLELVQEEVREQLDGTTLQDAPIIPVSAPTGDGIPELLAQVEEVVSQAETTEPPKLMRMPIDRVFQISGHGTIVTGTLLGGEIRLKDEVDILPAGVRGRVRQIQVHDDPVEMAEAGQRVALNLGGVEKAALVRGDVVVESDVLEPTTIIDAKLTVLGDGKELTHRERVRIHIGTSEVLARLRTIEDESIKPGETGYCQLVLEGPVVAAREDLFILRTYSPAHTVAGGKVLNASPLRWKRRSSRTVDILKREDSGEPEDLVRLVFELQDKELKTREDLRKATLLDPGVIRTQIRALIKKGEIIDFDNNQAFVSAMGVAGLWEQAQELLDKFHQEYALRKGYPKEELRSRIVPNWESKVFNNLLELWAGEGKVDLHDKEVSLPGQGLQLTQEQTQKAEAIAVDLDKAGFSPPSLDELATKYALGQKEFGEIMNFLNLQGTVIKVAEGLIFHTNQVERAKELAKDIIKAEGGLETAVFRDATNSSRKYAIALLEYFDGIKWTKRIGDKRLAGPAMKERAK